MEEKKNRSWRDGIHFAMALLLILAGIFYLSYVTNLSDVISDGEFIKFTLFHV